MPPKIIGPFEYKPKPLRLKGRPDPFGDFRNGYASDVVFWLNHAKNHPAFNRVVHIHTLLTTLHAEPVASSKEDQVVEAERQEAVASELNSRLKRYASYPRVDPLEKRTHRGGHEYHSWRKSQKNNDDLWVFFDFAGHAPLPDGHYMFSENSVVDSLIALFETREISSIRLCEQCKEIWLVSRRRIDRFCSDSCRVKFHTTTEEAKARHVRSQQKHREKIKKGLAAGRYEKLQLAPHVL